MTKMTAWTWFALLLGFFVAVVAGADENSEMNADYVPMPKDNTGISMSSFMLPIPVITLQTNIVYIEAEASNVELDTADYSESSVSSTEEDSTTSSGDMPTVTVEEGVTTATASSTLEFSSSSSSSSSTTSTKPVSVIVVTRTIARIAQETGNAISAPPAPAAEVTAAIQSQSSAVATQTAIASSDWRAEMLSSVNAIRASVGKPALVINAGLNQIAQAHSSYQLALGILTHNDATTIGARVSSINIKWAGISENIASGQTTVAQVMQAWKNSPGHYANMIGDYDIVGFGQIGKYWTQDFVKYTK